MKRYRVEVVQTNVFFEEAESETEARRIAAEDRIWDEDQRAPDYYGVHFNVEEVTSRRHLQRIGQDIAGDERVLLRESAFRRQGRLLRKKWCCLCWRL